MNNYVIRAVDEFGRISLPKDMRKILDIAERDKVLVTMENDAIVVRKYDNVCVFCGSDVEISEIKGKYVCSECARSISASLKK